jgi:hypothetical protein
VRPTAVPSSSSVTAPRRPPSFVGLIDRLGFDPVTDERLTLGRPLQPGGDAPGSSTRGPRGDISRPRRPGARRSGSGTCPRRPRPEHLGGLLPTPGMVCSSSGWCAHGRQAAAMTMFGSASAVSTSAMRWSMLRARRAWPAPRRWRGCSRPPTAPQRILPRHCVTTSPGVRSILIRTGSDQDRNRSHLMPPGLRVALNSWLCGRVGGNGV